MKEKCNNKWCCYLYGLLDLLVLLAVRTYSVQQYLVDAVVQLRVAVEYWACR